MTFAHEIDAAAAALEATQHAYLRRWGWVRTCATPGAYWLWKRDFADYDKRFEAWHTAHPDRPGKPSGVMTLPTDLAVSMTRRALDEQPELAAETAE